MNSQFKKGIIELCVLKELLLEDKYGYSVIDSISKHINVNDNTIYPILRRLNSRRLFWNLPCWIKSRCGKKILQNNKKRIWILFQIKRWVGSIYWRSVSNIK